MKPLFVLLFATMIIAQWFIPIRLIVEQESTLANGKIFKFKTQPIDPSDPFRGKYITLRFEEERISINTSEKWKFNEDVFVSLHENEEGFARVAKISKSRPDNADYVKAKINYVSNGNEVGLKYPFERFYLEESKASKAERIYWEAQNDSTQVTYAEVRVMDGESALHDVKINERSIVDIVGEMNSKAP